MAKDIKINGVTYRSIPRIEFPLADNSGKSAVFIDADDVSSGASEFVITLSNRSGTSAFIADKTANEIWAAARRGDMIWFRMGYSLQRALIILDQPGETNQLAAMFVGNFGRGWGFYQVYYVSGLGVVVDFHQVTA